MTETNDYDKAKQECKEAFRKESDNLMTRSEERAINFAFDRAYQLGKAHSEDSNFADCHLSARSVDLERNSKLVNQLVNERLQVASMAMQGLLANATWLTKLTSGYANEYDNDQDAAQALLRDVTSTAVEFADALIAEVNKEKG